MPRSLLMFASLFAISFMGFFGYLYFTRPAVAIVMQSPAPAMGLLVQRDHVRSTQISVAAHDEASSVTTMPPETVTKWIVEVSDADPKIRATAIAALATAPRAQAIPALQRVLSVGESADRPLALRSLHTLALQQGDVDGGIRDTFRQAVYDGRDEALTPDAQAALNDVETHLDQIALRGDLVSAAADKTSYK